MKKNHMKSFHRTRVKGERLHFFSTVTLLILILFFLYMTIRGSKDIAEEADKISEHPFEVVVEAGNVKQDLSEIKVRYGRLLRHQSQEDIDYVENALHDLELKLQDSIAQIDRIYLGDHADVIALEKNVKKLCGSLKTFLASLTPDASIQIEAFEMNVLQPAYEEALQQTEGIIEVAQNRKVIFGENVKDMQHRMMIGSLLVVLMMVSVLLTTQYLLWKQKKELAYRTRLFDNLAAAIDDSFIIRDVQSGEINYCAANMERILGFTIDNIDTLYQGLSKEDTNELKRIVKSAHGLPYENIVKFKKPNNELCLLSIKIYKMNDMETPQLITILSDRTNEVKSRQALQDAMRNAEKANMAKSEFLSRMSHEVRTPLHAILGMAEIAAVHSDEQSRVNECLAKIKLSSNHLLMLINDVLDMSKIESSKMALTFEPFDIFEVVHSFVSTIYAQTQAKEIMFTERMRGFDKQTMYVGDALRIRQILLNIGSNAVKFTEPHGRIHLQVERITSKNMVDVIQMTITDTGIGMEQSLVDRIFQPFEQADTSLGSTFGGTGLGMAITRNLVTLMDGDIHVESTLGKGTRCLVELPLKRGHDDIHEPDFRELHLKALIVDDDKDACIQTANLLSKLHIASDWFVDGAQAIKQAKQQKNEQNAYDLCLIGWKMEKMNGLEVVKQLRQQLGSEALAIIMMAYDITEVEKEAREAGANGFLPKPMYRSCAYRAIQEALHPSEKVTLSTLEQPLKGYHLLLAEDNELNSEITVELLKMNGAVITCAKNGKEALDLYMQADTHTYDAILMDIQMPIMDGYEATQCIRQSTHEDARTIPIVAVSANAFRDDITASINAGMNAHISKPIDIQKLCATLMALL